MRMNPRHNYGARRTFVGRTRSILSGIGNSSPRIQRTMDATGNYIVKPLTKKLGGFGPVAQSFLRKGATRNFATVAGVAAFGMFALSRGVFETMSWLSPEQNEHIGQSGAGPGYIGWSKKRGMPANHLSTEGLGLALHDMRHTSSI